MSMHLVGPHLTTTTYNRRKKSKDIVLDQKFRNEFNTYNKQMRRLRLKEKTLEEYIAYTQGKSTHNPKIIKDPFKAETYRRESPAIPSSNGVGNGFAKAPMQYSGDRKLIGIGTLHKSNMVPIFEQSDAEDIAKMRR